MKPDDEYLSISDFSILSGIKRKNLIFYDECGILHPDKVGVNGYRYYSSKQLGTVQVIMALREMGVTLKDIKEILQSRSPEKMRALFQNQENRVLDDIKRLEDSLEVIHLYQDMIHAAEVVDEDRIVILERDREEVFFGPVIQRSPARPPHEHIREFYESGAGQGVNTGFPLCMEISRDHVIQGRWDSPYRYYCKAVSPNGCKAAGTYVIGYERGRNCGGGRGCVYRNVVNFMNSHKLRPAGNAYEERLVNEVLTSDRDEQLLRLEIQVEHT